jgi:hypothetical protein
MCYPILTSRGAHKWLVRTTEQGEDSKVRSLKPEPEEKPKTTPYDPSKVDKIRNLGPAP